MHLSRAKHRTIRDVEESPARPGQWAAGRKSPKSHSLQSIYCSISTFLCLLVTHCCSCLLQVHLMLCPCWVCTWWPCPCSTKRRQFHKLHTAQSLGKDWNPPSVQGQVWVILLVSPEAGEMRVVGQWGVTLNFGKEKKDIQIASCRVLVCSKLFQAHLIDLLLLLWVPGGGIFTLAFAGLQSPFGVLDDKWRLVSEVALQRNSLGCRKDPAAFQAALCSCCP